MKQPVMRISLVLALLIAMVFGFVSGIVGELWINGFLAPDIQTRDYRDLTRRLDELTAQQRKDVKDLLSEQDFSVTKIIEQVTPAVVGIYPYRAATKNVAQLLASGDMVGTGFVMTSDGWIVTTQQVVPDAKQTYAVRVQGQLKPVTQTINDALSHVVFIKVDASNLPVVNVMSRDRVLPGQSVLVASPEGTVTRTNVASMQTVQGTATTLLHTTEAYYSSVTLSTAVDRLSIGAPVFTLDGNVFGIAAGDFAVIPIDYVTPVIKAAVKNEPIVRPWVGVQFVDIEQVANLDVPQAQGAYVTTVSVKSPAADAGIVAGDVIVAVDTDAVNRAHTLTQLIQEYQPGDVVSLTYVRAGKEAKANVTLAELKK